MTTPTREQVVQFDSEDVVQFIRAQNDQIVCLKADLGFKVAELEESNDVLSSSNANLQGRVDTLTVKLAASQLEAKGLRDLMKEVEDKYFALLKEKDQEAEELKAEGDMYGWNFHTGMRSGAVQMHLDMTKLIKALSTPNDDTALREYCAAEVEKVAQLIQPEDSYQDDWFKAKADCYRRVMDAADKIRKGGWE